MKTRGILLLCVLLAGCDQPNETQLRLDTSRQLQRTIDTNPLRASCEDIARGREWLTPHTLERLQAQGCQNVLRSATETNFLHTEFFHRSLTTVCGSIRGKSFTGTFLDRRFIYSYEERYLVIEPMTEQDKTRFEGHKTLQQLQDDFNRQTTQYCQ
ncbi:hypothetical protein VH86_22735 [Pantoea sp. BL1]|uniref:Lipoprotein n=1 Tax=Pantoea rwandensis TaxID=1076550 RepID=A0ABM5RKI0_9GAMM|nr:MULTISPECIES: hypothetical protein [Erwiniaceae]HAU5564882.1 hypothetical protein [Serratia fonticola]AIR86467.1 hypothetical protein LH22_13755 [Pantoea rwandensis]KJV35139.1 hypothetical protein VI01_03440 [Pantoea sp. SM3]KJV45114.1 hypothetical protein VH86_22735 [Pantoea sp. BL1]MBK0090682.1 hypothetical protein [Erwinia sp. S59]